MLNTVNQCGLGMVQRALGRIDHAAEQIAKASMNTEVEGRLTDLLKPIVELHKADLETQAAVKRLRAEKKEISSLLDVTA